MRLTEFWQRMDEAFGALAPTYAEDSVLRELGGRTVREALDAGLPAKEVWRAVCTAASLPARLH